MRTAIPSRIFVFSILPMMLLGACGSSGSSEELSDVENNIPSYSITYPGVDQAMIAGTQQTIRWDAAEGEEVVDISLVWADGKMLTIAEAVANTGTHTWSVPIVPETSGTPILYVHDSGTAQSQTGYQTMMTEEGEGVPVALGSLAAFRWNKDTSQQEIFLDRSNYWPE